ncbi:MAG: hypothetical protein D6819_07430 [Gammaproteobacteria bacterium]|nr:MAG: hypothetical protein D6819_07430 [Gammaproteobacteria bacterium]
MRALAAYLLRGPWQAMGVSAGSAFLSLLFPPLSYVSGAAVALVTLTQDTRASLQVIVGSALIITLLDGIVLGNPWLGGLLVLILWGPLWMLAKVLQHTASLALTLEAAVAMAILGMAGLYLWLGNPELWWRPFLDNLRPLLEPLEGTSGQALDILAPVMTGILGAGWLISLILSLFLARWWQSLLYRPSGFRREFHRLRLGRGMAVATLALLAMALWGTGMPGAFARDAMMAMLVAYLLAGLALIHDASARFRLHWGWLALVYGGLLIEPALLVPLLAMLGWVDSGFDIRRHLPAP